MRIYAVRIFVDDLAKARAFYGETLGLKEVWTMTEMKAVGFDLESAQLIVEEEDPEGEEAGLIGRFVGLSLQVDDIEESYRQLKERGVAFEGPPEKQPWGGTLADFKDPAGNLLTLLG
ncbi:MAG: hypothetical protein Kilf2KO_34040 [Rhodospirillales bacterium]